MVLPSNIIKWHSVGNKSKNGDAYFFYSSVILANRSIMFDIAVHYKYPVWFSVSSINKNAKSMCIEKKPKLTSCQVERQGHVYYYGLILIPTLISTLTLSQWSTSGNPLAIQCAWNLDPSVQWNATGERILGSQCASSGLPVAFKWSSSVFQLCKLTLDRHWDTTGC